MSEKEVPIQKSHASGSWRVVRSMAVPANVMRDRTKQPSTHHSGSRKIEKIEQESVLLKPRKSPGYFETVDHLFSKSN